MGKPGFSTPPPAGGSGLAQPSRRGYGETGFPHTPARWAGYALTQGGGGNHAPARWAGYALTQGGGGNHAPTRWAGYALTQGGGGNHAPTRWAGYALTQGEGETGFPPSLTPWEGMGSVAPHPPQNTATRLTPSEGVQSSAWASRPRRWR